MSPARLERHLVRFVNGLLRESDGTDDGAASGIEVDEETALFEEGVIDSLRILDLIAFVERATGTAVPDSAVRLANFRSIRAIATAFGGNATAAAPRSDPPPLRVFTSRGGGGFASPVESLEARGELEIAPPGRLVLRGAPRRLLERFDALVAGRAREAGAVETRYAAALPREALARAGRPIDPTAPPRLVPPAVCYHVYRAREGRRLPSSPALLTARGRCLRDEPVLEPALGRLRDFEMREIVALGTRDEVEDFRGGWIARIGELVEALDLEGAIETADDPFFLPDGTDQGLDPGRRPAPPGGLPRPRGRRLMQRVLPLKYELRLVLDADGRDCAVASFNHHLAFFGRRFGITLPSGAAAHTGCVAFGLERWVLALLARHGTDERAWPDPLRDPGAQMAPA